MKRKFLKFVSLMLVFTMLVSLVACTGNSSNVNTNPSNNEGGTILAERFLEENFLHESFLEEIFWDETFLHETFLEERLYLENFITEQLLLESVVREVLLVETIFIPEGAVCTDIDVTLLNELFGHDIEISSLLTRFAIGGGVVLTLTILDTFLPVGTVATLVASAARGAQAGAAIGGGLGTISGAVSGFFDVLDETGRINAVGRLGLSITGLVVSALTLKAAITVPAVSVPLVILSIAGLGASLFGLGVTGYNAALTFSQTESINIDWNNIDWGALGYATATRAVEGMADGIMFGAIIGSLYESARTVVTVNGKTVIQDPRSFDPNLVVERVVDGVPVRKTNVEWMRDNGYAPIGRDGRPVNLHHINQTDDGAILEISATDHSRNHSRLHRNPGGQNAPPSEIYRSGFDTWRQDYWRWRATQF